MAERNATFGEIIGADSNRDLISQHDANTISPQLASQMSLDVVTVFSLHQEGTAWVHFLDGSFHFDQIVCGHSHLRRPGNEALVALQADR